MVADAVIQKKIYGSGTTALIISHEDMDDIMKIVTSLKDSGLLKIDQKNKKEDSSNVITNISC